MIVIRISRRLSGGFIVILSQLIMLTKVLRYGVSLHHLEHNFNRNRNLIIHHGLMGSSKNFRTISKSKSFSQYFNSYLIDARNHGQSPHTDTHTIQDLADDLYEFIMTQGLLDPQKKLTLMGHSMGGMALMEFTKRYYEPQTQDLIDRIIIIDIPAVRFKTQDPKNKTGDMLKRMAEIDMTLPLAEINHEIDKRAISKDIAGLLKGDIVRTQNGYHKWVNNLQLLAYAGYQHIQNFSLANNNPGQWKKPVQLIYGERSGYFNEEQKKQYCKYYPQMKEENFHQIDKAGHWVHFENTQHFLNIAKNIFERDLHK